MTTAAASDEALMLRYRRGDRNAFAQLVRRHQTAVYNFVLRQLGSALSADEVAQQVFLQLARDGARFDYESPFCTRLFAIACRLVHAERARLPARRSSLVERGSAAEGRSLVLAQHESLEDSIVRAVDTLPNDQKDVFLLREVADLPFREIASIVQQPENTVKLHMQHALRQLRSALEDFDEYRRALR